MAKDKFSEAEIEIKMQNKRQRELNKTFEGVYGQLQALETKMQQDITNGNYKEVYGNWTIANHISQDPEQKEYIALSFGGQRNDNHSKCQKTFTKIQYMYKNFTKRLDQDKPKRNPYEKL
jgi:hypothetical protein